MDKKTADRLPVILLLIIGVILLADIVNVFALGGPSLFSMLLKPAGTGSDANTPAIPGLSGNVSEGTTLSGSATGQVIFVPTTATPVPVVSYISVVTPVIDTEDQPLYRNLSAPVQTRETDAYAIIYSGDLSYYYGEDPTAVQVDVKEPPLVIEFQVTPLMEEDSKIGKNLTTSAKKAGKIDELVNTTVISPQAEFTVTLYDPLSGGEISRDGFGLEYGHTAQRTITIRDAGNYIVQFDGKFVDAHVDMRIKREGNIA